MSICVIKILNSIEQVNVEISGMCKIVIQYCILYSDYNVGHSILYFIKKVQNLKTVIISSTKLYTGKILLFITWKKRREQSERALTCLYYCFFVSLSASRFITQNLLEIWIWNFTWVYKYMSLGVIKILKSIGQVNVEISEICKNGHSIL